MEHLSDPDVVREQYRTERRLETRRSVWRPAANGSSPHDAAAEAVGFDVRGQILEVGCGTGEFAARIAVEHAAATVSATDASERFVQLAAGRGLCAQLADVQDLPYADDQFDVMLALWMLYHVPDLDRGLREVRRVLRPDGRFVAVTNGDAHLADLMTGAGGAPVITRFSSENGAAELARQFGEVTREDFATRAFFDDHAGAVGYLATLDETLAANLPPFQGPREYAGATTVFVATP
jgi:ubiquinone/menaquinone biosynthesis C-methylase UbiE